MGPVQAEIDRERFAAKLKELREQAGLTQKQLADKAGIGQRTISHLEQGAQEPVWSTAIALCRALGVSCEDFLQEPADRPPAVRGRPPKAAEPEPEPKKKRGRPKKGT
jgi:putative transcriptional regulator